MLSPQLLSEIYLRIYQTVINNLNLLITPSLIERNSILSHAPNCRLQRAMEIILA